MRGRSFTLSLAIGALAGAIALAGPVQAQGALDAPANSGVHLGPLALSPVFRLTEFGLDSNPYNRSDGSNPVGGFNSRMTPTVDASLRSPHIRASGRSQFDFYYYKTQSDLTSVDSDNTGTVDFPVNRLTLTFGGGYVNTRHRQNLEIDAIAQRQTGTLSVGAAILMTGKTSVTVSVQRSRLEYKPNSIYLQTDLAGVLNHTESGGTVGIRYAMTNLTTVSVLASQNRARFDTAVDRNSEEFRITPTVEFSPFALVSGRAAIGYYKRTFHAVGPQAGSESGTNVLVDLTYILLGRTRFTIGLSRRLEYSYLASVNDYVEAGITGSVTQRLGESWDVVGRLGRAHFAYGQSATTDVVAARIPDQTVLQWGVNLGYNIGRIRIGGYLDRDQGDDELALNRGYRRLRIGSSAVYVF